VPELSAVPDQHTNVIAVGTTEAVSLRAARDLLSAGFAPQCCDVAPWALARSVLLAQPGLDDAYAVLELGTAYAQLAICRRGRPVYLRTLRQFGFAHFLEPLMSCWQINAAQAAAALLRAGLPADKAEENSSLARLTGQLLNRVLHELCEELARTWNYLTRQYPSLMPKTLWLCGAGGGIPRLDQYLTGKLSVPAVTWKLRSSTVNGAPGGDAPFAAAAELSALAWEEKT